MHCGVLLGAFGEIAMLLGGLGEMVVLMVVEGFVELGPDAPGGDGWCDPHAVTPTHAIRLVAISRIAFDMKVLSRRMPQQTGSHPESAAMLVGST
jgi:hypothetical protein